MGRKRTPSRTCRKWSRQCVTHRRARQWQPRPSRDRFNSSILSLSVCGRHSAGTTIQSRLSCLQTMGKTLISVSMDRTIRQWSVVKTSIATPAQTLAGKLGIITTVAIAPNGTAAALGSADGAIVVWEPKTGNLRTYPGDHPKWNRSPGNLERNANRLHREQGWCSSSLAACRMRNHGRVRVPLPRSRRTECISQSLEGKEVGLYDAATGKVVNRFVGRHDGNVVRIAFSPDGTRMITAGTDTKIHLWDAIRGDETAGNTSHR